MTVLYLDSSAIVKLIVEEPESGALRSSVRGTSRFSSELAIAEVPRGVARDRSRQSPQERRRLIEAADAAVTRLALIELTRRLLREAGALDPSRLRTLDAVHIVSARSLGDDLDAFVSYDGRQLEAAAGAGLTVASPGAPGSA